VTRKFSTMEKTKPWGSWLRAVDPKWRSFRGEGEFRPGNNSTQYKEVSEEVGGQSEGKDSGKELSKFQGMHSRKSPARGRDISKDSGSNQIEGNDGSDLRNAALRSQKDKVNTLINREEEISGRQKERYGKGPKVGFPEAAHSEKSSGELVERAAKEEYGPGKVVSNMDGMLLTNNKAMDLEESQEANSLGITAKKWKRLARNVQNNTHLVQAHMKGKKGRKEYSGNEEKE
jgi:hypothetical protein